MILTSTRIITEMERGSIVIDPFNPQAMNPNSINLRLAPKLLTYSEVVLDARKANRTEELFIPLEGTYLFPGVLYLGSTVEYTETHEHIPLIDGRSSIGRLGMFVHVTAGFGDIGFCGYWTLEIMVVQQVKIYPYMEICQISYHVPDGVITKKYQGRYQNNKGVQPCLLYED